MFKAKCVSDISYTWHAINVTLIKIFYKKTKKTNGGSTLKNSLVYKDLRQKHV